MVTLEDLLKQYLYLVVVVVVVRLCLYADTLLTDEPLPVEKLNVIVLP